MPITGLSEGLYQEMKLEERDNIRVCVVHLEDSETGAVYGKYVQQPIRTAS